MKNVKVSVVLPTYNRKRILVNCLDSLSKQTYPKKSYEVVIVDDGSTDGTEEVVKKFTKKLNIHYIKQKNKGHSRAKNAGIKLAKGEIIAFIDDDCIAVKDWLKNAVPNFKDKDIGGVEGRTTTDYKNITPLTRLVVNETGGNYQTCNILYRKKILEEIKGFDLGFKSHREDTDLAWRVLDRGYEIKFVNSAVVTHPPVHYSIKNLVKRTIKLKKSVWDIYLIKKHPKRYKKNIPIFKVFNPTTFMYYPFYISLAFLIFSIIKYPQFWIFSLIFAVYVYSTTVLMYTNELCRSTTFRQLSRYPKELSQLLATWWIVMFVDLILLIYGMIKYRRITL